MITSFAIGTSAIDAAQTALTVIGQNVANSTNAAYHDQTANLVSRVSGATVAGNTTGTGVDVASVTRATDGPVDAALIAANSGQSATGAQLSTAQQVQDALNSGAGGLGDKLSAFFNDATTLTSQPDSTPQRQQLIADAGTLANQLNTAADSIGQLQNETGKQITTNVTQLNTLAGQIATLNKQIAQAEAAGQQPNALLDQRDTAINSLAQLVDFHTVNQPNGVVNLIGSGAPIVVGQLPSTFQVSTNPAGGLVVSQVGSTQPVTFSAGSIGGQLQDYNTNIPAASARLNAITAQLVQQVNQIQATGVGLNGPLTATTGSVNASSATAPLSSAGLPFTVQAGQLTVSVTDATGNRTNTTIAINPATSTLQSVATALNGVTGLQASVTATNQLQVQAQAGFSFDFAGRDTNPPGAGPVANPDTSGVLAALGVNGFFTGSTAGDIAVNPTLAADPNQLAASTTGQPGDSTNAARLAAVQNATLINGQTLSQAYTALTAAVGGNVQAFTDQQTAQSGVIQNLTSQGQSVSGVNTNQEFVNLLTYQKLIQASSEYLTAVNTALGYVLNIIQ
jgi:flagellar hook-associated protein 1 FlgK